MPSSGTPYILVQTDDPDSVEKSPLWPLQQAMRGVFTQAVNNGLATPAQAARVWSTRSAVDDLFRQWKQIDPERVRAIIRAKISPPELELVNDPVLMGFQQALLDLPQWNDTL